MVVPMYNTGGEKVGEVELSPDIFETSINVPLMHQALVRQLANARQGTHKAKSRGEVDRTKAKWYRQKGTGRARQFRWPCRPWRTPLRNGSGNLYARSVLSTLAHLRQGSSRQLLERLRVLASVYDAFGTMNTQRRGRYSEVRHGLGHTFPTT